MCGPRAVLVTLGSASNGDVLTIVHRAVTAYLLAADVDGDTRTCTISDNLGDGFASVEGNGDSVAAVLGDSNVHISFT